MAIAGILMVGLSTFFASTFHNMFQAQAENAATERQYAINQIVADKMSTVKTLIPLVPPSNTSVLTLNQNTKNQLPFTFMSLVEADPNGDGTKEKYLGFKDMFPFNKIIYDESDGVYIFGDSGSGQIKGAISPSTFTPVNVGMKNFAGFTKLGSDYYVAVPDKDEILKMRYHFLRPICFRAGRASLNADGC